MKKRLRVESVKYHLVPIWSLHDACPVFEAFHGLHLLRHCQNFLKSGAESRHVLEVCLLLHLDRQIIHPGIFQNGRHLQIEGGTTQSQAY